MYQFYRAKEEESNIAFEMLKSAAIKIQEIGIDHWQHWHQPDESKKAWIQEGFNKGQFYFVHYEDIRIGMFRLMEEDLLYWGKQEFDARYVHSLVVLSKYSGKSHGHGILNQICHNLKTMGINRLRLDSNTQNKKLCKYYLDYGFAEVGIKKKDDGSFLLMEKLID